MVSVALAHGTTGAEPVAGAGEARGQAKSLRDFSKKTRHPCRRGRKFDAPVMFDVSSIFRGFFPETSGPARRSVTRRPGLGDVADPPVSQNGWWLGVVLLVKPHRRASLSQRAPPR